MTGVRQHPLTWALLASLLLHLLMLVAPGWQIPLLGGISTHEDRGMESRSHMERTERAERMNAHLAAPPRRARPGVDAAIVTAKATVRPAVASKAQPPAPPRQKAQGVPASPQPRHAAGDVLQQAPVVEEIETDTADAVVTAPERVDESRAEPVAEPARSAPEELATAHATAAPQVALPRHGSVRFAVTRGNDGFILGQTTHRWQHDGRRYSLESVTETTGLVALFRPVRVVWKSEGEMDVDGLRPQRFRSDKGNADFDWPAMKLALSAGSQREAALTPGVQDVLSMFYQLGIVLPRLKLQDEGVGNAGNVDNAPASFTLLVTTGRKLERYRFENLGQEALNIGKYGMQPTVHLRTPADEQAIDIWLGLNWFGLPVRIRYTDGDGGVYDQLAADIEISGY